MTAAELKAFRQRNHYSQTEAAEALGCSLRSITNWEKGKLPIPGYIALAASAVAFGLPPMGGESVISDVSD